MTMAVRALLPRSVVRAVNRFWKTQAELSLLPDPEQGLETSPVPSRDNGQSQGFFRGPGYLPWAPRLKQLATHRAAGPVRGRRLGFSFSCKHWSGCLSVCLSVFLCLNSWWAPLGTEEMSTYETRSQTL